jgi:hypothetical protein
MLQALAPYSIARQTAGYLDFDGVIGHRASLHYESEVGRAFANLG